MWYIIRGQITKALGVGVDIDELNLSVFKGTVRIDGLTVKNPAGYAHKNLLELSTGKVVVSTRSLLTDTVNVNQIKLDGINLVIEQKGLSNNLQDIIKNISSETKEPSESAGKKLHIAELEITNINVKVKLLPVPGKLDTISLDLPAIEMTDLGSDNQFGTKELVTKIILAISDSIAKHGAGILPDQMLGTLRSALDQTIDIGKAAAEQGKKILETGKDAGSEVVEGLKGLFKPRKKK